MYAWNSVQQLISVAQDVSLFVHSFGQTVLSDLSNWMGTNKDILEIKHIFMISKTDHGVSATGAGGVKISP